MTAYIVSLDNENYNEFVNDGGLRIVDVMTEWCGPCKQLSPIFDELSADFKDVATFGKIDADVSRDTVTGLGVRNIPTILVYNNGEVVDKLVGKNANRTNILDALNKYSKNAN